MRNTVYEVSAQDDATNFLMWGAIRLQPLLVSFDAFINGFMVTFTKSP